MHLLAQTEILKSDSDNITLYSILRGFYCSQEQKNPVYIQVFLPYFSNFFRLLGKKTSITKLKGKKGTIFVFVRKLCLTHCCCPM